MESRNASTPLHSPATVFCLFESLFVGRYPLELMHPAGFISPTTGVKPLPQPQAGVAHQLSPPTLTKGHVAKRAAPALCAQRHLC